MIGVLVRVRIWARVRVTVRVILSRLGNLGLGRSVAVGLVNS